MLNLLQMGIKRPEVRRGIDPHADIRSSAMSVDGPGLSGSLVAHEFVCITEAGGLPALEHLSGAAAGIPALITRLEEFSIGHTFESDPVYETEDYLAEVFDWIREKICLVIHGSEQTEMPLITNLREFDIDSAHDAAVKVRDAYFTGVLFRNVPVSRIRSVVLGGTLSIYVDVDPLSATAGALEIAPTGLGGSAFTGWVEYPILGTKVNKAETAFINGVEYSFIDFDC